MEKLVCAFAVDDRLFHKTAIFKTAYLFIDRFYIRIEYAGEHTIRVVAEPKPGSESNSIEKEFCNELLAQMLRYQLHTDNLAAKELIIGRALYSSCIELEDHEENTERSAREETYSLDDIAVDWFEVYEP